MIGNLKSSLWSM